MGWGWGCTRCTCTLGVLHKQGVQERGVVQGHARFIWYPHSPAAKHWSPFYVTTVCPSTPNPRLPSPPLAPHTQPSGVMSTWRSPSLRHAATRWRRTGSSAPYCSCPGSPCWPPQVGLLGRGCMWARAAGGSGVAAVLLRFCACVQQYVQRDGGRGGRPPVVAAHWWPARAVVC